MRPLSAAVGRGQSQPVADSRADLVEPFTRAAAGLQLHHRGGRPHRGQTRHPQVRVSYLLCLLNRVFFTPRPTHVSCRIGDVGPRQEAKASLQFSPSRAGATVLLVNFDSDKLNSIKSSINVDVREWASDAALLLFTFNFYSPFLKCLRVSVILTFLIHPLFTLS